MSLNRIFSIAVLAFISFGMQNDLQSATKVQKKVTREEKRAATTCEGLKEQQTTTCENSFSNCLGGTKTETPENPDDFDWEYCSERNEDCMKCVQSYQKWCLDRPRGPSSAPGVPPPPCGIDHGF